MRITKIFLSLLALTILRSASAVAMPLQDPIKVNVQTDATSTTWCTSPAAIALGALIVLLIIVLIVMASRKKKTTTTVIR